VIASLNKLLPGYQILSMQDLLTQISVENPGPQYVHQCDGGIAIVIAFAVCASQCTGGAAATREIGILKSLGASRGYVLE